MGFFRRRKSPEPDPRPAQLLLDRADRLAETEPGTAAAVRAANEAVDAAETLLRTVVTVAGQRRVSRACWRRAWTLSQAGRAAAAVEPARRCWRLAVSLVEGCAAGDPLLDLLIGELVERLAVVEGVLADAGLAAESSQAVRTAEQAVTRAGDSPAGRRAAARLRLRELARLPPEYARRLAEDGWDSRVPDELRRAAQVGDEILDVLLDHVDDGPAEVTEAALALHAISRLWALAGESQAAQDALEQAITLASTVLDRGPAFEALHDILLADRDALTRTVTVDPAAEAQVDGDDPDQSEPEPVESPDLEYLFVRAAVEVGLDDRTTQLLTAPVREATELVTLLQAEEVLEPEEYGPRRGLALAALAWSWLRAGEPGPGRLIADQAVVLLDRPTDEPERVQVATVTALTVLARAARGTGRSDEAGRAERRAGQILRTLPAWNDPLGSSAGGAGPGGGAHANRRHRSPIREHVELLELGVELGLNGRTEEAAEALTEAEAALSQLWLADPADPADVMVARQLLRARWRLSVIHLQSGRPVPALDVGRRAMTVGRLLLSGLPAGAPDREDVLTEVATAAADLAEAAFAAGRPDEGTALLAEAAGYRAGDHRPG